LIIEALSLFKKFSFSFKQKKVYLNLKLKVCFVDKEPLLLMYLPLSLDKLTANLA